MNVIGALLFAGFLFCMCGSLTGALGMSLGWSIATSALATLLAMALPALRYLLFVAGTVQVLAAKYNLNFWQGLAAFVGIVILVLVFRVTVEL